ncbi:hypothetical protein TI10_14905 [Photorhabdus luminescens subsp. luminescens]|uniref:Uncharacterized protein n=1 Tax=Photorhabdus luminescens TaxID=29488 RepID=A0A1G5RIK8_PHOLU|nr:hypothetical protein [Photorhabdus luminescens]KMW72263.1 hypothetical protein TI10_14905 [Photorhabdus luminescens subsp. luminescens]MCW7762962.1 hypothetical protein [Photorhabdus luminescens subsp. venezuelensis]SCZ73874.1 hypothetical protein SAMN02982990_04439 [Photorhabdus luminescens]
MLALKLNNFLKRTFIILVCFGVISIIPILFVNVNFSYTKNDFIKYNIFTFDEIKRMPFISSDYIIYYDSPDGTKPMINEIVFSNVNPNRKIELINYIENIGFLKNKDDYWHKGNIFINIKQNDTERTILFSVEKN